QVVLLNATLRTGHDPFVFARQMQAAGAGEIVLNSVDSDGMMKGYPLALVEKMRQTVQVPLTVLGGAGSLEDIRALVNQYPIIGAGAGSLFVFKGKYRAVLINYPSREERDRLARVKERMSEVVD